ncbi:MAG: glutamine amidotransferase family, partial [Pseudonocardiales bacterium]|nr:glutamine amidotransferase family [Pseudonocardiales bacterium]
MITVAPVPGEARAATAPAPVIGVLALQGDVREHLAVLAGLGAEPVAVRRP